jgi:hypothetical protein
MIKTCLLACIHYRGAKHILELVTFQPTILQVASSVVIDFFTETHNTDFACSFFALKDWAIEFSIKSHD